MNRAARRVSEYARSGPCEHCALAYAISKTMCGMKSGHTYPLRNRTAHVAHARFEEIGIS